MHANKVRDPEDLPNNRTIRLIIVYGSAVAIVAFIAAYALTGWFIFLIINLLVCVLAVLAFIYLMYRRSKLTMRM